MYSHVVFFELTDNSDEARQALIDGFETYLAPHDGILVYTASIRDESKQRDVNDLTFDVALTLVFESVAAQDAYQVTDAHKQFIEELSGNWASVRVFDSVVSGSPIGLE
ncbi:Dabb family protein [Parvularcula flava]|nr:Dabb family protein [Aquisalinus luteolus]